MIDAGEFVAIWKANLAVLWSATATRAPLPPKVTAQPVAFWARTGLGHALLAESGEPVAAVAGSAAATTATAAATSTPADVNNAFMIGHIA
jgi:hypothetical protein